MNHNRKQQRAQIDVQIVSSPVKRCDKISDIYLLTNIFFINDVALSENKKYNSEQPQQAGINSSSQLSYCHSPQSPVG